MSPSPQDSKREIEKAYFKSIKFISYRDRSEKEVKDFLVRKKVDPKLIDSVIKLLREQELINDRKFANWWIEQRQEFKGKSKSIIKSELIKKGVNKLLIDEVLEKTQEDLKTATLLLEKNKYRFDRYKGDLRKIKITNFLKNRGYNWDIIEKLQICED